RIWRLAHLGTHAGRYSRPSGSQWSRPPRPPHCLIEILTISNLLPHKKPYRLLSEQPEEGDEAKDEYIGTQGVVGTHQAPVPECATGREGAHSWRVGGNNVVRQ